jgi:hypothetical protein
MNKKQVSEMVMKEVMKTGYITSPEEMAIHEALVTKKVTDQDRIDMVENIRHDVYVKFANQWKSLKAKVEKDISDSAEKLAEQIVEEIKHTKAVLAEKKLSEQETARLKDRLEEYQAIDTKEEILKLVYEMTDDMTEIGADSLTELSWLDYIILT